MDIRINHYLSEQDRVFQWTVDLPSQNRLEIDNLKGLIVENDLKCIVPDKRKGDHSENGVTHWNAFRIRAKKRFLFIYGKCANAFAGTGTNSSAPGSRQWSRRAAVPFR